MIPYVNRTVDVILSTQLEARDVNVREVIDELKSQFNGYADIFEAVVLVSPGTYRITCKSSRKLELFEAAGFFVRGLPVEVKPINSFKWVNISRLSYGVPEDAVRAALAPYGDIRLFKLEKYSNIYTGVRHVLMEIRTEIPTRIRVAGHHCVVHYKGQKRPCFSCGLVGHYTDKCPTKSAPGAVTSKASTSAEGGATVAVHSGHSYASVVTSTGTAVTSTAAVVTNTASEPVVTSSPIITSVSLERSAPVNVPTEVPEVPDVAGVVSELLASVAREGSAPAVDPLAPMNLVVESSALGVEPTVVIQEPGAPVVEPPASGVEHMEASVSALGPAEVALAARTPLPGGDEVDTDIPPSAESPSFKGNKRSRPRSLTRSNSRSPMRRDRRSLSESSGDSARDDDSDGIGVQGRIRGRQRRPATLSTPPFSPNIIPASSTIDSRTSSLTQFTPNLPCDTQDRINFAGPEVSSDEFSFGDTGMSSASLANDFA